MKLPFDVRSINTRFFLLLVLPIALLFLGVMRYNYLISKSMLKEMVIENTENVANAAIRRIDYHVDQNKLIAQTIASRLASFEFTDLQIKNYLTQLLKENKTLYGTCIAFEPYAFDPQKEKMAYYFYRKNDSIYQADLGSQFYDYPLSDWYLIPKIKGENLFSEPYYDHLGGNEIMITYSVPVYRQNQGIPKLYAIVTIDLSVQWLKTLVEHLNISSASYSFMISQNGLLVTHPDQRLVLNESIFSLAEMLKNDPMYRAGQRMISGQEGFNPIQSNINKEKAFVYYLPIPSLDWSIGIIFSEKDLFAGLNIFTQNLSFLGGATLLLLLVLMIWIVIRITGSLKKLSLAAKEMGQGTFDQKLPQIQSRDEVGILAQSLQSMQAELKTYTENLANSIAQRQKMESELQIAHELQMSMLPQNYPAFPQQDQIDLFGTVVPARDVGGDLFDYFFVDPQHLCLVIGDVSGKGVPAALFMATTRALIRAHSTAQKSPNEIVSRINNELAKDNPNAMFVTLFLAIYELPTQTLQYCNAGHNAPYLKTKQTLSTLENTNDMAVGVFSDQPFHAQTLKLLPGNQIVLFTDGVTEAMNLQQKWWGDEQFKHALQQLDDQSNAQQQILQIQNQITKFVGDAEASDDITIMIMRILK